MYYIDTCSGLLSLLSHDSFDVALHTYAEVAESLSGCAYSELLMFLASSSLSVGPPFSDEIFDGSSSVAFRHFRQWKLQNRAKSDPVKCVNFFILRQGSIQPQ